MAAISIELRTLKDCLQFLEWLKNTKQMHSQVARELATRMSTYYSTTTLVGQLPNSFTEFLENVSKFYHKLCKQPDAGHYNRNAKDILDALLECLPKFLAAMYYLWYNVDYKLDAVGGAKWRDLYVGWEAEWRGGWGNYPAYGGGLQEYLRLAGSFQLELIPGGFFENEVTYGYNFPTQGYTLGSDMIPDLRNILEKKGDNNFRDVFVTTVKSDAGAHKASTGNAIALVETFCDIVKSEGDKEGGELKKVMDEDLKKNKKCINWNKLKSHCAILKKQLNKIFNKEGFSYTGQSPGVNKLNAKKFAEETARWFRNNLLKVQQNVRQIDKRFPVDDTLYVNVLQKFATEHIFPYGFIFGEKGYGTMGNAYKTLSHHWPSVIAMLGKDDDGLKKLKTILDGETCPQKPEEKHPKEKQPEAGQKTVSSPQPTGKAKPDSSGSAVSKPGEPKPTVTTTTPKTPQGAKADGTPNQGSAGKGAQSAGNKSQGASNQNSGRNGGKSTTSSSAKSPSPASDAKGAPSPPEPKGDSGNKGPTGSKPTNQVQTSQKKVPSQQTPSQPPSVASPPATPPKTPAAPASPGQPGAGGGSQNGGGAISQKPGGSPQPGQSKSTIVKVSGSSSSGASAPGNVKGPVGPAGSSGSGQPVGQGKGAQGGDPKSLQTVVPPPTAPPKSSSAQPPGPPSSVASGNGGGKGQGGKGKDTQGSVPPSSQTDAAANTLATQNPSVQASAPPSSGAPGPVGGKVSSPGAVQPRGNGQDAQGGGITSQKPAGPSQPAPPQPSSVKTPAPPSSSVPAPGGGTGSASVPGKPSGNGQGREGGYSKGTQPGAAQSPAPPQAPGAKPTGSPSPVVPAPGNGQGTGDQVSTSSTTQHGVQGTSQSSTTADITASSGAGTGAGGGGGEAGGSNGKDVPVPNTKNTCPSGLKTEHRNGTTYCHPSITLTRRPDFKVSNPDEVWNAIQSKTLPSYITTPANNQTTPQYKTVSTSVNHPNHTTQGSIQHPTDGRNRHGKPYYVPADGRPRKGVMGIRDVPSLDFDGESIPDKSLKRIQEEMRRNGELGKKRVAVKVRAKHDQALRDVQDRWNKDAEKIKTEDKEWRKRQEAGKLLKQSDDYAIVQQERKRAAAEALQKKLDDHRIAQEEELKKIQSAPSVYLDGSQPVYQYPYVINNHQEDFLSMYSVDGSVIPDPYKDQNDSERKRKSDDALHDILTEKQLQLALNLETEQKFKEARDVELQKFLHHVQDKSRVVGEGLVSGKILTPSQPESYKYQALTAAYGTPMVDKRHLQEDYIGKLQREAAGDDWNDYVQRRKESLDKEAKLHRDEVAKKNSDAIEAIKSMGIPQVITEHAPRRPSPILYELPHFDIQVAKDTLPENNLDFDLDFDDDSTHIKSETPTDFVDSSFPAISFNLPPPDPEQSLPPPEDFSPDIISRPDLKMCIAPWMKQAETGDSADTPETELFPAEAPRTVRDMLIWLAGLQNPKHHGTLRQCINKAFSGPHSDPSQLALSVNGSHILPQHIIDTIHLTAIFAGSVLTAIAPRWRENVSSKTVQPRSSDEPDCCALLCQLRDYVYACHHQLEFLKAQCKRDESLGGWQDYKYGSDIKAPSPLQAFLTDGWDSTFETHLFDPCNLCHKSRVRMGFRIEDLPSTQQTGSTLSTILTPSCGGSDPLLTLSSYLNCLTRRTPRTTGELVSYFHHFGNSLHDAFDGRLLQLGNSLSTPHDHCPDWDRLDGTVLQAVQGIRGSESLNSISNHKDDHAHPRTLSTLLGCSSDSDNCHPHCSPITYRAYALYSQSFAHTYLSWTVYLPDRLWESLEKLHYDLLKHCGSGKCSSLYSCSTALPLLYLHGFTPPEGKSLLPVKCSDIMTKLKDIVNGKPIASLMTAMDNLLYNIREPFIFTLVALWSLAFLIFANTMLYRIDVLHIRSHLIRTKASHLIDVKALLSDNKKMLSLYDANYFDDDPNELLNLI